MNLARTLDDEVIRVAKEEGIPLRDLIEQLASLTQHSTRQIYNYRSGQQLLPGTLIPILCKRFNSRALIHALEAECDEASDETPDEYDLTRMVSQTVRQTLAHYEKFLAAFEDGVITASELDELVASGDRVVLEVNRFKGIAKSDYQRRARLAAK